MGSDKKEKEKKEKTGKYRLGSAIIWAAAQWGVEWFGFPEHTLGQAVAAAFGGLIAGWTTASLLGLIAKWGAGAWPMMIAGLLIGVAVTSGAVHGIDYGLALLNKKPQVLDTDKFLTFLKSWSIVPALVLGVVTGLYVRIQIPRKKAK